MPRLERLQGFGAEQNRALTCICSRIIAEDNESCILVVATERAGPDLTLDERAAPHAWRTGRTSRRVFRRRRIAPCLTSRARGAGQAKNLEALGAETLARNASRDGHATGRAAIGDVTLDRLTTGNSVILLLTIESLAVTTIRESAPPLAAETPAIALVPGPGPAPAAATSTTPIPFKRGGTPLRFVWQSDADHRFLLESETFLDLAGWTTKSALGSPWPEFAAALGLDPEGRIEKALTSRQTWSGIAVAWPVEGTDERVTVELSGLPVIRARAKIRRLSRLRRLPGAGTAGAIGPPPRGDASSARDRKVAATGRGAPG